ncbi:MAG: hotdog fold thioesterase [Actinomycetota bacterium]
MSGAPWSDLEQERIRELFASDELARELGVELVQIGPARVELELLIEQRHIGWHGRGHGGVLFTLADVAMSYVGNRFDRMAFATQASVDFLGGVEEGDRVRAVATESARAGRAGVCDATLSVGERTVALFRGNTLQSRG